MIRRFTLATLLLAGVLFPAGAAAGAEDTEWAIDDVGPASAATPTGSGHFIDDILWFSTRQTSPTSVVGLDPATREAIAQVDLPEGQGAWVTAVSGTDVYVGTYTPAKVYRVDTTTGAVEEILTAGGSGAVIYAMVVAPDGVVYTGTYASSGGRIFSYDPATDTVTDMGVIVEGQDYVRALEVDEDYLYAGIGSRAHLVRIDRSTGAIADITPSSLDGATFVSSLALHEGTLLGGISPRGQLLALDTTNPDRHELVQAPNERFVVAITGAAPGEAYFAARPSGTLYRYSLWSGTAEAVAVPAPEMAANGLTYRGGLVWGLVDGSVYSFDSSTGTVTGYPLDAAGVPASPERPMAMAVDDQHVFVAGSAGVQVHDISTGQSIRHFVPGEAKSITPAGDTVYLSLYTQALIYSFDPRSGELDKLADIGNEQTRPRDSHYQQDTDRLLVGTEPDYGKYGGALAIYHAGSNSLDVYRNIVPDQTISAVTADGGAAYVGSDIKTGLGTNPIATRAELAAVDIATGDVIWSIPAPGDAIAVTDLITVDDQLVGITSTGLLFGVDPATRTITWTKQASARGGPLTLTATGVYTSDGDTVFRVTWTDLSHAPAVVPVASDLAGEWYGWPTVVATPDDTTLYTTRGRTLVRIAVPARAHVSLTTETGATPLNADNEDGWRTHAAVTVTDPFGRPLSGVRVEGHWEPRPAPRAVCVTDDAGQCTVFRTVRDTESVTLSLSVLHHRGLPDGRVELDETHVISRS